MQALAFAEQVVGGVVDADEGARQSADAAGQADAVLALFLHLQRDVDRAVLHVLLDFRILFRLQRLEILQLVQPQQAEFPQVAVVDLAFFQRQFAADDFVARRGVALELDAADVELLAFVEIDPQADGLLLVVGFGIGDGREVDVAQRGVGFAQVLQAFADGFGVEDVAIFDLEERAGRRCWSWPCCR